MHIKNLYWNDNRYTACVHDHSDTVWMFFPKKSDIVMQQFNFASKDQVGFKFPPILQPKNTYLLPVDNK